jgi:hypothetical protein
MMPRMSTTLPRPAASYSHAHHAVFFRGGWLPPTDDAGLEAARSRHEELAQALASAVERQRALPLEHQRHERSRREAMAAQARGETVQVPKPLPGQAADQELEDAAARVDACRQVLAEHAQSTLALIETRRERLRAAFVARADEARVQAEQLEAQARELRAEEARRWVLPRWLDATIPGDPTPPRFDDLAARDPALLDEDARRATGRLTESDRLLRSMGTGVYTDDPGDE